jgi:hypothetical protein
VSATRADLIVEAFYVRGENRPAATSRIRATANERITDPGSQAPQCGSGACHTVGRALALQLAAGQNDIATAWLSREKRQKQERCAWHLRMPSLMPRLGERREPKGVHWCSPFGCLSARRRAPGGGPLTASIRAHVVHPRGVQCPTVRHAAVGRGTSLR